MKDNVGIGVMLSFLTEGNQSYEAVKAAIGKRIKGIEIVDENDGQLLVTFADGAALQLFDAGRSCCESRYMQTDDDLSAFVGAEFRGVRVEDGPTTEDEYGEAHESQFLLVDTSLGTFTVTTHNEHNGYYGGFAIVARFSEPEAAA